MILWDVRDSVQILASQFAEFFCGVNQDDGCSLATFQEDSLSPLCESHTPQYILKKDSLVIRKAL